MQVWDDIFVYLNWFIISTITPCKYGLTEIGISILINGILFSSNDWQFIACVWATTTGRFLTPSHIIYIGKYETNLTIQVSLFLWSKLLSDRVSKDSYDSSIDDKTVRIEIANW